MATMKKQAKATAVKKGTFYECVWCGKEGTNSPYYSSENEVVCGRTVEKGKMYFCSEKCQHIYCVEHNRKEVLADIEWANDLLDDIKNYVDCIIKAGVKISPPLLQMAKLLKIHRKVATLIVSGDKPSARKLYDEKKELVTECAEDVLADKKYECLYMAYINKFAELDAYMKDDCSI